MNPLEPLQTQPTEQLHHNLDYVENNKRLDFVAEALKEKGRSIEKTVELLYSAEKNDNQMKVRKIVDFVNGFEGLEKISDESIENLGFEDVTNSFKRYNKSNNSGALSSCIIAIGMAAIAVEEFSILNQYFPHPNIIAALGEVGCLAITALGGTAGLIHLSNQLSKKMAGDQKPREAYCSLVKQSSDADRYIQLYKVLKEKGFYLK